MLALYPSLIEIWRFPFLWKEENRGTRNKPSEEGGKNSIPEPQMAARARIKLGSRTLSPLPFLLKKYTSKMSRKIVKTTIKL